MSIQIDPEIYELIPPLSKEERQQLRDNIKEAGRILSPGVTWRGILLDGHNRHAIATELGIEFPTVEIDLPDRNEALIWVIRHQFGRRNLSDFSRSELALKLKPLIAAKAKERMVSGKGDPVQNSAQGKTRDGIADVAGVSHDTIGKVEKVKATGTPELQALARDGDVSVSAAATVATLPPAEQRAVVAGGAKAVKAKAAKIRKKKARASVSESPEPIKVVEGVEAVEVSVDPKIPWAAMEAALRLEITALRGVAHRIQTALEYDSKTKRYTHAYAKGYSHAGLNGAILQVIRSIETGMPVELAPGTDTGYRTAYQAELHRAKKEARHA